LKLLGEDKLVLELVVADKSVVAVSLVEDTREKYLNF
jgi:hypothetical protein